MSWESCGPAAAGSPSAGRPLRGPDGHVRETASTLGFWGTLGSWPPPVAWSKASQRRTGSGGAAACSGRWAAVWGTGSCAGLRPPHRMMQVSWEQCRAALQAAESKGRPAPGPARLLLFPKAPLGTGVGTLLAISDLWDTVRSDTVLPSRSRQHEGQRHRLRAVRERVDQGPPGLGGGAGSDLHLRAAAVGWSGPIRGRGP